MVRTFLRHRPHPLRHRVPTRTFVLCTSNINIDRRINSQRRCSLTLHSCPRTTFDSMWYKNCSTLNKRENDHSERSMDAVSKEIWTIPNMITMSRIVASPGLTYAIACDMKGVALGGCVFFGFTDWLDGYVAKRFNMKSILGGFLDPLADKIFIGALTIGLAIKGLFPVSLAVTILSRDVVLVAASFAIRARERPAGAPFFDTTNSATFRVVPSELSKINTVCQIALLVVSLGSFASGTPCVEQIDPLYWITGVTTVGSGLGYLDGTGIKRIGKSGEYRDITSTSALTADAVQEQENK